MLPPPFAAHSLQRTMAFDACAEYAVMEFQEKPGPKMEGFGHRPERYRSEARSRFHDSIVQLLHTFPLDHVGGLN